MTHYTRKDVKSSTPAVTFSQKWGDDPFTELGHTQIPNALLKYAVRLKLAPDECWLTACILSFKHTADDPFPAQDTLAAMYGRSVDTVQRVCKSLELKGVLGIQRKRNDSGHFSHIVYDFRPLRAALNECYYQDHPDKRPRYSRAVALPQGCGMADGESVNKSQTARMRDRKNGQNHTAKRGKTIPQGCGTNQTLEEENKKDLKAVCEISLLDKEKERRNIQRLTADDLVEMCGQYGIAAVQAAMREKMDSAKKQGKDTRSLEGIYREVDRRAKKGGTQ